MSKHGHPTKQLVELGDWYASSVIAEGLFASWARDKYGECVRWLPKKLKDVTWDGMVVDVKDAFVDDVRTANGQKEPCLGFMGTARGPGEEAREGVTHFGLVVRDVAEGPDLLAVTADGHMTIQTQCHFSIYLVPSDEINRFLRVTLVPESQGYNVIATRS